MALKTRAMKSFDENACLHEVIVIVVSGDDSIFLFLVKLCAV